MNPTPDSQLLPPPIPDFVAAKRQYMELYGSLAVMNTYLKIAVLCLSLVSLGLTGLVLKAIAGLRDRKILVVGIDSDGRPHTLGNESLEYHPQEREIRYFLMRFVQDHYSRMRMTMKEDYERSLYFLDAELADSLIESNKNSKAIESFLAGGGEENDVTIINVAIEDLRKPPYKATVEFEKIYYSAADHRETRREPNIANFVFVIKQPVANALIPVNPLGITITYFREDQAFQ